MKYRVVHDTRYRYSSEVTLGYNRAVLRPRDVPGQRLSAFALDILPPPDDRHDHVDLFGNMVTTFAIERPHSMLEVSSFAEFHVVAVEPQLTLAGLAPWKEAVEAAAAAPGAERAFALDSPLVATSEELGDYAAPSFTPGRSVYEAVTDLTERIHADFEYRPGSTSVSTPAAQVLARREGVCQDFAHLQIACLRSMGLAARYVSGYLDSSPGDDGAPVVGADASHAWCAVRLPDGAWLDLDPTNRLVDPSLHLTVAWGRDYGDVAPLSGVVFSGGATSALEVAVSVERVSRRRDGAARN